MTADDSIHLTGPYGDDYPVRVVFDDFDDAGVPASGVMQSQGDDGKWHTVARLDDRRVAAYWADFKRWFGEAAADAALLLRSAA